MQRHNPFRSVFKMVLCAAGVLVLAVGALVWDGLHDEIHNADVGVVLGNTVYPDGTPSPRLAARLDRAVELYRAGIVPLLLVSGATGKEGRDEGVAMRDYLVRNGVPAARIIVDSKGVTTFATAVNTRQIMDQRGLQSAMVITQYFHVSRTKLALHRAGIHDVYAAHARYFEMRDLYSTPRELVGIVSYAFKSYRSPELSGSGKHLPMMAPYPE